MAMKKYAFALTAGACFVGVLGALQVDKWLSKRPGGEASDFFASVMPAGAIRLANTATLPEGPADFKAAAKRVNPSVVSIDIISRVRGFFDDRVVERQQGSGSGVIVSADGVIVTNNHVVAPARGGKVRVRLFDGRALDAKVLGTDPRSDIAVIKVDAKNLTPIEIGTSSTLEVGEWVIAVGNPLGFDHTLSVGVVSTVKRNLPIGDEGLVEGIQTDAAINPGNSGGALCNVKGQLVGINTAIASSTGQSVGIGFAVPVDRVKRLVADIVKFGAPRYAGLGIGYYGELVGGMNDPYVRESISRALGRSDFPTYGLLIKVVEGPAAEIGMKRLDILTEIEGQKVESQFDLNKVLINKKVGDKVKVKFWQAGQIKEATATLYELKPSI